MAAEHREERERKDRLFLVFFKREREGGEREREKRTDKKGTRETARGRERERGFYWVIKKNKVIMLSSKQHAHREGERERERGERERRAG